MALTFEIKFAGENWKDYGFTVVKDGIKGIEQMRDVRLDIEWPPASNTPVFFGSEEGEWHLTVSGLVKGTSRSNLKTKLESIKANLAESLTAPQELCFGDQPSLNYTAVYDGTFNLKYIGPSLTTNIALLTVGFLVFDERE